MRPLTSLGKAVFLAAALLIVVLQAQAGAQRLEISNQGIRATFEPLVLLAPEAEGPGAACRVVLEGTFHSRTIAKEPERLIGYITRAILSRETCVFEGGAEHIVLLNGSERDLNNVVVPNSLPWHIRYESFVGRLPTIEEIRIRIILFSFLMLAFGISCLYRSTVASPARFRIIRTAATNQIPSIVADSTAPIPRAAGPFLCPAEARLGGEGTIRVLGSTTVLVFVRLI
jgi:hypothetical protein